LQIEEKRKPMKSHRLQILFSTLLLLSGIGALIIGIRSSEDNFLFSLLINIGSALLLGGLIGIIDVLFLKKEYEESLLEKIGKLDEIINKEEFGIFDIQRKRNDLSDNINSKLLLDKGTIKITGISLRGLFGVGDELSKEQKLFRTNIEKALKKRITFKILVIHPKYAKFREELELRRKGDIAFNVFHTLQFLIELQKKYPNYLFVKLLKGVPSTFMIFFDSELIFSPYTYGNTGIESYTFRIRIGSDLYHYYDDHHFENIWNNKDVCLELKTDNNEIDRYIEHIENTEISDKLKKLLKSKYEKIKSATNNA
jgi:hypothetical protein